MISSLAEDLTQRLLAAGRIAEEEQELYTYGFFLLLSRLFFLAVTLACSLIAGLPAEGVLFYGMFTLLRSYAGGAHARTESACTLLTGLALCCSILAIRALEAAQAITITLGLLAAGDTGVLLFSPLDAPEKPLDNSERKHYRSISLLLVLSCSLLSAGAALGGFWGVAGAAAVSTALEGILLTVGKFTLYRRQKPAI